MRGADSKRNGAVIVTRVSTGEQAKHGTSLESQLDACRCKAVSLNLPIVAEYEDAGISGGLLLLREGMQQAIADIKAGRADTLICANISRYSRDVEHQWKIKRDVEAAGGRIVFCDMQIDDTPEGDLFFGISGSFAQYERELIRSRTMKGRAKRIEDGQQPSRAHSPYGYHIVKHADITRGTYSPEKLGKYTIVPVEAEAIKYIFEAYATGQESLSSLCRRLYERGIKPRRAKLWSCATLADMLTNPVYKGKPVAGRYRYRTDESRVGQIGRADRTIKTARVLDRRAEDEWTILSAPPIVSEELWEDTQHRLKDNKARKGSNPRRCYLLSGLVYCPNCGSPMMLQGKTTKSGIRRYYICSQYQKALVWAGERRCERLTSSVPDIEAIVVRAITNAVTRPGAIREAENAYRQITATSDPDEARKHIQHIDNALSELAQDERATVAAQVAGIRAGALPDSYATAFADIALRRKDLENQRALLTATVRSKPKAERGKNLRSQALSDVQTALTSEAIATDEKRKLVRIVVAKVVCRHGGADVFFYGDDLKNISVIFRSSHGCEGWYSAPE